MDGGLNRRRSLKADIGILLLASWGFVMVGDLLRGRIAVVEAFGGALLGFGFGLLFLLGKRSFPNRLATALWASAILTAFAALGNLRLQ